MISCEDTIETAYKAKHGFRKLVILNEITHFSLYPRCDLILARKAAQFSTCDKGRSPTLPCGRCSWRETFRDFARVKRDLDGKEIRNMIERVNGIWPVSNVLNNLRGSWQNCRNKVQRSCCNPIYDSYKAMSVNGPTTCAHRAAPC